jgi:hypothetical protein
MVEKRNAYIVYWWETQKEKDLREIGWDSVD